MVKEFQTRHVAIRMTPSVQWRGLQGVWPFRREIVQKFIDSLDFEYLCRIAETTRSNSAFSAKVHKEPFSAGRERLVFQIEFSDGTLWVARISLPPLPTAHDDSRLLPCPGPAVMLSEVTAIRLVSSETSIPVPQIHTHNFQKKPFRRSIYAHGRSGWAIHPAVPINSYPRYSTRLQSGGRNCPRSRASNIHKDRHASGKHSGTQLGCR